MACIFDWSSVYTMQIPHANYFSGCFSGFLKQEKFPGSGKCGVQVKIFSATFCRCTIISGISGTFEKVISSDKTEKPYVKWYVEQKNARNSFELQALINCT